ncbi:unnamed protein product [Phytophthora fragariaefolia]|uniref:Unnamed protein product n=1 Tax=Phytophthora fragariaefolia TaxID=1490495 RepID=A0A9W6XD23_9STRA|nr:unnamed protein product [Phytophthora fragariaefolia]
MSTLPQPGEERCAVVRLAKTVKLPTNTRSIVRVKVDAADGTTGVFLPKWGGKRHLMVASTVDTVRNGMVQIAVLNVEGRREKLPAGEASGKGITTEADIDILSVNGELERTRVAEWVATLRKEDAAPLQEEEKLDIGEMETADRDLVLALLRQYAEVVEKKERCLPLSKTGVLGVAEEDKAKTAFTTHRGLFQFRRMPFGLCNALSTFQRLMDCVLCELTWVCCLVYLDDIVIFTRGSVARHVVELAVVLERFAKAGLSLKATKCSFATTSMAYLGHDLTPAGIKPTDRLVKAVTDFPKPQDEAAVRRFVALAGYYRRFMPDFGSRMAPLTKLLRKLIEWVWAEPQEEAFAWAKAWLSKKPVLIYPDYRLPLKLTTDASKTGLGAVLETNLLLASKVNSPLVAKYNISVLGCLAVVWVVRLFRPHLYGRKFTTVTGHVALKWLMTAKELAGRLHRWVLTLQEYDFDILYRTGKENHVADALPRGPTAVAGAAAELDVTTDDNCPMGTADNHDRSSETREVATLRRAAAVRSGNGTGSQEPEPPQSQPPQPPPTIRVDMVEITDAIAKQSCDGTDITNAFVVRRLESAEMGAVQFTDADIRREQAKSVMVQMMKQKGSYHGRQVVVDIDGLVNIEGQDVEKRVVLPAVYWELAFKEAHDSIWSGHPRGPQTLARSQRMYWWPHMKGAVRGWVSACQDCGSRKAKPQIVVPPLRSVRTGDVCDRWAIDVAGPLPVTEHGNRYVIAAVEYTTRYVVAVAVPEHTAKSIARFLMHKAILIYVPMREIMMGGAREFGSEIITELLELMQTKQATPVPYRPKLLGLVERFHHTRKDIVRLYVSDEQDDCDDFLPCMLCAYNGAQHAMHGFQPNELMMGRKLRTAAELLRRNNLKRPHRSLDEYHEVLTQDLQTARDLAATALQKEQARQAMYYNQRNVRQYAAFRPGQLMLESGRELVTHCSFLISYYYPTNLLSQMAKDIALDLREEAVAAADVGPDDDGNILESSREAQIDGLATTATQNGTTGEIG